MRIYILILTSFLISNIYSQNFRTLSGDEQQQVDRLKETANIQINGNNAAGAASTYSKIALIYWRAGVIDDAISNFSISADLFLQNDRFDDAKNVYTNMAVLYTDAEELEFALEYFEKSLLLRRKVGNKTSVSAGLIDVAYINQLLGFYEDAIAKLEESLKLATDNKDPRLILACYQQLGTNYELAGNMKKYQEYMEKADSYMKFLEGESINEEFTEQILETQQKVAKTEEEKRLAAELFKIRQQLFEQTRDSMRLSIMIKEDSLAYAGRIAKQKELEIENLNQQKELQDLQIKEQRARAQMIAVGLILMIILAVFMLYSNRARRRANIKLEAQNKEIAEKNDQIEEAMGQIKKQRDNIQHSINYAKGIQKALLPKTDKLNQIVKDSFVLFKPRDVVSGDFYWFREVDAKSNIFKIFNMHGKSKDEDVEESSKKILISAVDCTGHGVPGAFMSMIGYNLLDEISGKGITRPDLILEALHQSVRSTLKQDETSNQDGMDMALCSIDPERKIIEFAGAKNPLIYVQNGEVSQVKGSKSGVGGKEESATYDLHTIEINGPTCFYIFSDGFIDQFGGDEGRKYMIKKFRSLLHQIHSESFEKQKEILEQEFENWIGKDYYQIDDVLVIGFKLDFN